MTARAPDYNGEPPTLEAVLAEAFAAAIEAARPDLIDELIEGLCEIARDAALGAGGEARRT